MNTKKVKDRGYISVVPHSPSMYRSRVQSPVLKKL
jgi:hypothetical protein